MSFAQLLQSFIVETMGDMVPFVHFAIDKIGDLVPTLAVKQGRLEQRPYIAYPCSWRGRGRQQEVKQQRELGQQRVSWRRRGI